MKLLPNIAVLFFIIGLAAPQSGISQGDTSFELGFDVNRVSPKLSISKDQLKDAEALIDLNQGYKADWVRDYTSVEITTIQDGEAKIVMSENDKLTKEQKDLMEIADINTDIKIKVRYSPENSLSQNDIKEMKFSFTVNPESEASYVGGEEQLKKYLQRNAIDKLSQSDFKIHNLTAIKFAIDEKGQVFDAKVVESSSSDDVDALLMNVICEMPGWEPAKYANGTKVKREFVFTVGDHRSCIINVLDIVAIDKFREVE